MAIGPAARGDATGEARERHGGPGSGGAGVAPLTILGGGPAGLALAYYATRADIPVALYEKSTRFGGLCSTFRCGEHLYDSGAHRFHDRDPEVTRDVRALLGDELLRISAPSQIYERGRFVDFPPTPLGLILSNGLRDAGKLAGEIISARLAGKRHCESFADFAVSQFGPSLARRFLLDYSEKLWGLPAVQLSPDVATRRLQGMTVRSLLVEMLLPGRKAKHIDGEFLYPRGGYGRITDALAAAVPEDSLHGGRQVSRLDFAGDRVRSICFGDGTSVEVGDGRVASTLPLTRLVELLGDRLPQHVREEAGKLRFRHIRLLFLRLAQPTVTPNASIYIPDARFCVSRLYEPRNRSAAMAPVGETSLVVEAPCFAGDPVQLLSDEAFAARVIDELSSIGLVQPSRVVEWRHHFLANAYPVYSLDYTRSVQIILAGLPAIANLDTAGRSGRFFYGHLHDQMRFAKDYVAALTPVGAIASQPA